MAFVWDWPNPWVQMISWRDGLSKAIYLISQEWDVKCYSIGKDTTFYHDYFPIYLKPTSEELAKLILKEKPDAILVWADMGRPTIPYLANKGIPMALCLAGGTFRDYVDVFELFFVESKVYKEQLEREGKNVVQAFGTNTELFKPRKQKKIWDAIFPATYASWKRHKLFAEALGDKGLTCGWMYTSHEVDCYGVCQEKGMMVLPHTPADVLTYLYNASRTCVITSNSQGGSQRTVLEAMAVGIPPVVMADSDKTTEYVEESGFGKIVLPDPQEIRDAVNELIANPPDPQKGIDYIKSKYTAEIYAQKVKEGILSIR